VLRTDGAVELVDAVRRALRGESDPRPGRGRRFRATAPPPQRAPRRSRGPRGQPDARELETLREAALGRRNDEIAGPLGMHRHTVRTHVQEILTTLGVRSKLEAVLLAIRHGRVAPLGPQGRRAGDGRP